MHLAVLQGKKLSSRARILEAPVLELHGESPAALSAQIARSWPFDSPSHHALCEESLLSVLGSGRGHGSCMHNNLHFLPWAQYQALHDPPAKRRSRPTPAPTRLIGDYGSDRIDGYLDDGRVKARYAHEAKAVLERLRVMLGAEARPRLAGHEGPAVRFNPAGPGVGGDASVHLYWPGLERGAAVYLSSLGLSPRRVSVSGVSVMWRLASRKNPHRGEHNRWEDFDVPLEQLAERIRAALEGVCTQASPLPVRSALLAQPGLF